MLFLGIDFGTSGARGIIINDNEEIITQVNHSFSNQNTNNLAKQWKDTLYLLLKEIPIDVRKEIKAISINGTSSTVLLCDSKGEPIEQPILYNEAKNVTILDSFQTIIPEHHLVKSSTSSLVKLLWWYHTKKIKPLAYFLHQADWLGFLLHGKLGISDYHNALKLGYDVENLCYPDWLKTLPINSVLPQVLPPGTPVETVNHDIVQRFNFPKHCRVCTGTTDSIAAFLASGAKHPGEAVTSLGSTLVLKLLSNTRIEDISSGIYSHRLGNLWLTGGASNTGGAVLKHFFRDEALEQLSQQININQPTTLDYYPLLKPGERFPINNPNLVPKLEPIPENKVEFLQGLLESIAKIEALGYEKLQALGATPVTQLYTAGGGAKNENWAKIRQHYLQVPVKISSQTEAAYGTALLAKRSQNN
ncbi:carbohydrate kinase, FGGY family [Crocosphaera subtropica ATCC 51142]|uniref:D-ribulose kinase n=1 Tax=Crocosphaera subtropica (strain ATCC 51142 / BH68) TaxID=43989 RepID=B1X1I8_CROS5|nr:FGGY-family carbohydrate kinase [Crocosphaera subtropica]ACB51417.1 carbohydrate kinase, FGGY family [Crocosphaera subtropica ATCC 51142]